MKFPKLKNTVVCQALLYFPAFSFSLWIIAAAMIPEGWVGQVIRVLVFILLGAFSVWYLLYNMFFLIASDVVFYGIRQWKLDRSEYRTRRNGIGRNVIERTLRRRCARWGKRFRSKTRKATKAEVYYRHGISWVSWWSAIEKKVVICTAETLTKETYDRLLAQVNWMLAIVPDGKIRFKSKSEKKAPRARASVILFLADTVDEEVKRLVREPVAFNETGCILPCAIQCSDGSYYLNCTKEYCDGSMIPKSARNYAAGMIRKLVFSHRLPKENWETQLAWEDLPNSDMTRFHYNMTLWEYCKSAHKELRSGVTAQEKEREKQFRRLKNGEVFVGTGVVWYKRTNRLAECVFMPVGEDEKTVALFPNAVWFYRKNDSVFIPSWICGNLNRRKMKKDDLEQLRKVAADALLAEGYQIQKE